MTANETKAKKFVGVKLSAETATELKALADKEEMSVSCLLRSIIREHLAK